MADAPFILAREVDRIAERLREPFDIHASYAEHVQPQPPPAFGEKLVEFFQRRQFGIGVICYVIAVATAVFFAFQLGRGVL